MVFTSKEKEPQKNEDITNTSDSFELQKLKIQAETDKHKRENLMTMMKEGLLTFEQFKICFEVC